VVFELQFKAGLQEVFGGFTNAAVEDAYQWLHSPLTKDERD
jgi:hypothetical protein